MKRTIAAIMILTLCLMGCGAASSNDTTKEETKATETKEESKSDEKVTIGSEPDKKENADEPKEVKDDKLESLVGEWKLIMNEYDDYRVMSVDEDIDCTLTIYLDENRYRADYLHLNSEGVEVYGAPLELQDKPLNAECKNQEWSVCMKRGRSDTNYELTLSDTNELEMLISTDYTYLDEDDKEVTDHYESLYTFVPTEMADSEELLDSYRYDETITVSNIKELYNALDNNKHIILKEGVYNISKLSRNERKNKKMNGFQYEDVGIEPYYNDCIMLRDMENVFLEGEEGAKVTICTEDPYEAPLGLTASSRIHLKNLILGHEVEPGYCSGAVLLMDGGSGLKVEDCKLYGSGAYGFEAYSAYKVSFENCEIYECTYGLVDLYDTDSVTFTDCALRDSVEFSMFDLTNCWNIVFEDCKITGNETVEDYNSFIQCDTSTNVVFRNCIFKDNKYKNFIKGDAQFIGCDIKNN